jgi:hypothetical protein
MTLSALKSTRDAVQAGPRVIIFHSPSELDLLRRPGFVKGRALLLLQFPGIAPDQLQRWQRVLNSRFNACGCATGAATGLCGLLGAVIAQSWLGGWGAAHWVAFGLRAAAGLILGTGLGKIVGIRLARWDLRRVADSIQGSITFPESRER